MEKSNIVTRRDEALTLLNPAIAPAEMVFGTLQKAATAVRDSVENAVDGLTYWRQLQAIKRLAAGDPGVDLSEIHRQRENTKRLIAYSSVGAATLSLYGAAESVIGEKSHEISPGHIATTTASMAVAGLLTWAGHRIKKAVVYNQSPDLQEEVAGFHVHAKLDLASSAVAVAGAGLHMLGTWGAVTEQLAGASIAAIQAKKFWPSKKNALQEADPPHDHEHHYSHTHDDDCGHAHLHVSDIWEATRGARKITALGRTALGKLWSKNKEKLPTRRRLQTVATVGLAAVAFAAGVAGDTIEQTEAKPPAPGISQDERQQVPTTIEESEPELFAAEYIRVEPGDSQWSIVQAQLQEAIGQPPNIALTNAAALFTAHENLKSNPNPHALVSGNCISLPSDHVLKNMQEAMTTPKSPLGEAILSLNNFASWEQAMNTDEVYKQLKAQLAESVAR